MPLYDCMLLMKPNLQKSKLVDLVRRVGKHVYAREGVLTDIQSFGTVQLGYGIKKRDGKHFEGTLMQLTMMVPTSFNEELHYLNKEERLLRWLFVKHRDVQLGVDHKRDDDFQRYDFSSRPASIGLAKDDLDDESDDPEEEEEEENNGMEE